MFSIKKRRQVSKERKERVIKNEENFESNINYSDWYLFDIRGCHF